MASLPSLSESSAVPVASYDTALCIIPPRHLWPPVDRLRALYDKAFHKWPPHINLVYPFVHPDSLPRAAEHIQSGLQRWREASGGREPHVVLDSAAEFRHKHDNSTLFRYDANGHHTSRIAELRHAVLEALGHLDAADYRPHMTVAQSEGTQSGDAHMFLLEKIKLMPSTEWDISELCILVRERKQLDDGSAASQMRLWGVVDLGTGALTRHSLPSSFYDEGRTAAPAADQHAPGQHGAGESSQPHIRSPYHFDDETALWRRCSPAEVGSLVEASPQKLAVASYNVLAEFSWPPSHARYPLIVKNILSAQASADILVLQEVTDDFLTYLLGDERIREQYTFTSHGPPDQPDVDPLPSFLNIIVLSKRVFDWELVPFRREHKGAVVARFGGIGTQAGGSLLPTILAAVHLSHGLTDGAVASKKADVHTILNFLSKSHPDSPWILAGDFNITTSSLTIAAGLKKGAITTQSAKYLASLDDALADAGLTDAWTASRFALGHPSDGEQDENPDDETHPGEQGATYDPMANPVAAAVVGCGYNMRPQRYDRILVRGARALAVARFGKFGFLRGSTQPDAEPTYASDHWGVRCVMQVGDAEVGRMSQEISSLVVPVNLTPAPAVLAAPGAVEDSLAELGLVPSQAEIEERHAAFDLLRRVLLEVPAGDAADHPAYHKSRASVVVVPVGSYGLGVWTSSSDIDVLCIGPFSSQTFFAVATRRLRRAAGDGVKLLRRVRASTGTMLELQVRGIKADLQYCPATSIAETWPAALRRPASDSIWSLPASTLHKLKAVREMDYLRRSLPSLPAFRQAHRLIRAWARSRGLLSARLGLLGGVHITLLLARVFKMLAAAAAGLPALPDVLATFFTHYAAFDWAARPAFDPLFHRQRLPHARGLREPLAVLGYFAPGLNAAHSASEPAAAALAGELRRAAALLGRARCWADLVRGDGAAEFLRAHRAYARVDVQYWGLSLSSGVRLLGWLESRCAWLPRELCRRVPGLAAARVWPARFVEAGEADSADGESDYRGAYLVGLGDTGGEGEGELRAVLRRFEESVSGDEKYFDARSCWVGAGVVAREDLGELVVDGREWGEYTPGEDDSDADDDDDDDGTAADAEAGADDDCNDDDDDDGVSGPGVEGPRRKKTRKGGKKDRAGKARTQPPTPKDEPGKRFRTAADVMNRLRWDPAMDSGDYLVGYEDRFVGAREKPLGAWRTEQTDEEFIPQHRILYFKRRSDGFVVWERRTRKDEVFSGK